MTLQKITSTSSFIALHLEARVLGWIFFKSVGCIGCCVGSVNSWEKLLSSKKNCVQGMSSSSSIGMQSLPMLCRWGSHVKLHVSCECCHIMWSFHDFWIFPRDHQRFLEQHVETKAAPLEGFYLTWTHKSTVTWYIKKCQHQGFLHLVIPPWNGSCLRDVVLVQPPALQKSQLKCEPSTACKNYFGTLPSVRLAKPGWLFQTSKTTTEWWLATDGHLRSMPLSMTYQIENQDPRQGIVLLPTQSWIALENWWPPTTSQLHSFALHLLSSESF